MARFVLLLCVLCLCRSLLVAGDITISPASPAPLVSAKAAILVDRQTGLVLWSYHAETPLPMASTTKIMTAIVILDHGGDKLDQMVTVSQTAAATGGSSLLAAGDMLTLRDLLKAILIRSSNEAAAAAAEYLAGNSVPTFVGWMNDKAVQILGPNNHTHFVNPHGLYDKKMGALHYTSAHDLAEITRYALTFYPVIREIVSEGHPPTGVFINAYPRFPRCNLPLENHNRILDSEVPGVPGARIDGVKTGFVKESGKCLVSSATLNGWQLVAVVLGGDGHYFQESRALLHYGFARYQWKTYAGADLAGATKPVSWGAQRTLPIGTQETFGAPLPRLEFGEQAVDRLEFQGERLSAPIHRGQQVGEFVLKRERDGATITIARAPAIALQDIPEAWWAVAGRYLLRVLLVLFALYLMGKLYGTIAKNRRRRRRRLEAARRGLDPGGAYYRQR